MERPDTRRPLLEGGWAPPTPEPALFMFTTLCLLPMLGRLAVWPVVPPLLMG